MLITVVEILITIVIVIIPFLLFLKEINYIYLYFIPNYLTNDLFIKNFMYLFI